MPLTLFAFIFITPRFAFAYLGQDTINNAILGIGRAFYSAGWWFVRMAVGYTTVVIANPSVGTVWTNVRNLSLEIFGIVILIIAFMNVIKIQIQTWGLNRMIPKMLLAVFLIVFSKFLCISLINFSHALVGSIMNQSTAGSAAANNTGQTPAMFDSFTTLGSSLNGLEGSDISTPMTFVVLIVCIICFFVFLILAIALFFRAVFLAFLIIISPFAFAMTVLPWTEKYMQEWMKNFVKWVFFFPICILILWVGMLMVGTATSPDQSKNGGAGQGTVQMDVTGGTGGTTDEGAGFLSQWAVLIMGFIAVPLSIWFPLKMLGAVGQGIQDRLSGKKGIPGMPYDPKAAKARWDKRSDRIDKTKENRLGRHIGKSLSTTGLARLGTGKDGSPNALARKLGGYDKMDYVPDKGKRYGAAAELQDIMKDNKQISGDDLAHFATGNMNAVSKGSRKALRKYRRKAGPNAQIGAMTYLKETKQVAALEKLKDLDRDKHFDKHGQFEPMSDVMKATKQQEKEKKRKDFGQPDS